MPRQSLIIEVSIRHTAIWWAVLFSEIIVAKWVSYKLGHLFCISLTTPFLVLYTVFLSANSDCKTKLYGNRLQMGSFQLNMHTIWKWTYQGIKQWQLRWRILRSATGMLYGTWDWHDQLNSLYGKLATTYCPLKWICSEGKWWRKTYVFSVVNQKQPYMPYGIALLLVMHGVKVTTHFKYGQFNPMIFRIYRPI